MSRIAAGLLVGIALSAYVSPARAVDAPPAEAPAPLTTRAFVIASYTTALDRGGDNIVGRVFGMPNDQFTLDLASLGLERAVRARHKEAGFAVRAVAGTSVAPSKAFGLDTGPDADVVQAVVQANLPVGTGDLKFMAGKMPSLLGIEGLDPTANPNASAGSQFIFLEDYTGTGLDAAWQGAGALSAGVRVTNGWDVVRDPNRARTVFGRIGAAPNARTSVAVLGYTGAEQPGNGHDRRSGVEFLGRHDHAHGSVQLQLDYGEEDGIDARWWGGGLWATWDFSPSAGFALRLDRMEDLDAARSGGVLGFPPGVGQIVSGVAATLNLKPMNGLLVRPEVRYDHSTAAVFDSHADQWTVALSAGCVY